jgi:hypothetical protein
MTSIKYHVTQLLQNDHPDNKMNILLLLCFAGLVLSVLTLSNHNQYFLLESSTQAEIPSHLQRGNLVLEPEGDYGPPANVSPCGPSYCWSPYTEMCVSCG